MVNLHYRSLYPQRILSESEKKNDRILVHIKLPNIYLKLYGGSFFWKMILRISLKP
jgi:hypothetical protein